jgi:alpha-D-ribose 1-methylphosphonate 5-phosphate C-P lyase
MGRILQGKEIRAVGETLLRGVIKADCRAEGTDVSAASYYPINAANVAKLFGRFRPCLMTTATKSAFTLQTRHRQRIRIRNKQDNCITG